MTQAILITAYKNINHLYNIVDFFNDDCTFYIHIDKKSKIAASDIQRLRENRKVKLVSQEYRVNWGSVQHLHAILQLCREAVKDNRIEYLHLITGHDYPIKTAQYISNFLKEHKGNEYLSAMPLPIKTWKWGGMNRVQHYNLYEYFNAKSWQRIFIKSFVYLQKLIGFKRKLPQGFGDLHGGSTYWTLTKSAVQYFLDYLDKRPDVLEAFRYTFCAEEILIHTILMNSPFRERVCRKNLRFMIWEHRDGVSPANLDERDIQAILKSDAFFARKFEYPVSEGLYKHLYSTLSQSNND